MKSPHSAGSSCADYFQCCLCLAPLLRLPGHKIARVGHIMYSFVSVYCVQCTPSKNANPQKSAEGPLTGSWLSKFLICWACQCNCGIPEAAPHTPNEMVQNSQTHFSCHVFAWWSWWYLISLSCLPFTKGYHILLHLLTYLQQSITQWSNIAYVISFHL